MVVETDMAGNFAGIILFFGYWEIGQNWFAVLHQGNWNGE
jgi:hypothetical protein